MINRLLRQSGILAGFAVVAGFLFATPSLLTAAHPPRRSVAVHVNLADTGKTVALAVGQDLVVTVPLRPYDDNSWRVTRNSGGALKLIAGPDERRGRHWTPERLSTQVFYFRREAPGKVQLVLEQAYWSRPLLLDVVDK